MTGTGIAPPHETDEGTNNMTETINGFPPVVGHGHPVVDGQIVLIDPQSTGVDITIIDDYDANGQPVIVRLSLDDLQRLRSYTDSIEKFGDKLAVMPQERRLRFTPYGVAWAEKFFTDDVS
jgi:hypothetical protein